MALKCIIPSPHGHTIYLVEFYDAYVAASEPEPSYFLCFPTLKEARKAIRAFLKGKADGSYAAIYRPVEFYQQ